MPFRLFLLQEPELAALANLYSLITQHNDVAKHVKSCFRQFLKTNGITTSAADLSRAISETHRATYRIRVYLFDYTIDYLAGDLRNHFPDMSTNADFLNLFSALESIFVAVQTRVAVTTSKLAFVRSNDTRQIVPIAYLKEFFGYRRSANEGGLIRFYLKITPGPTEGFVNFDNMYVRNGLSWRISGDGFYFSNTLYMQGMARNMESQETLGMRYFALRDLGEYVSGVVVSMDNDYIPIAAKVLLIPVESHLFDRGFKLRDGSINWRAIIERRPYDNTAIAQRFEEFVMRAEIKPEFSDKDILTFNSFISNATATTLSVSSRITNFQYALERLREYALQHELDNVPLFLDEVVAKLINKHVDDLNSKTH
jgi:hypothetical protein